MDAVISGQFGMAMMIDGNRRYTIRVAHPELELSADYFRQIARDADDLEFVEQMDPDQIHQKLHLSTASQEGLTAASVLLDGALSEKLRLFAAQTLAAYLEEGGVRELIQAALYACPLPEGGDLEGALACSAETLLSYELITTLKNDQERIKQVAQAWDDLPDEFFHREADKAQAARKVFQAHLARSGWFLKAVIVLREQNLNSFKVNLIMELSGLAGGDRFWGYRQVVNQWLTPLSGAPAARPKPMVAEKQARSGKKKKRKKGRQKKEYRLPQVERQLEAISALWDKREFAKAENYISDLVETSQPEYAAKSLCNLAIGAKRRGLSRHQLELARQANDLYPQDPVTANQYADALHCNGDHQAALEIYEETKIRFPNNAVAHNGRAEVLRALNRLDDALAAYDHAITSFPNDVVAHNGRAETLIRLGKLDLALAAYRETRKAFPYNEVAQRGMACCLARMGHLEEALETLPTDPLARGDWIGLHIKGMILLRLERLDDALRIFRQGISQCPDPTSRNYFRGGIALAYLKQNQPEQAKEECQAMSKGPFQLLVFNAVKAPASEKKAQLNHAFEDFFERAA